MFWNEKEGRTEREYMSHTSGVVWEHNEYGPKKCWGSKTGTTEATVFTTVPEVRESPKYVELVVRVYSEGNMTEDTEGLGLDRYGKEYI